MEEPREPRRSRLENEHFSPQRRHSQQIEEQQQPIMEQIQEIQQQLPLGKYEQQVPNFIKYAYQWIVEGTRAHSFFNYYTNTAWYKLFNDYNLPQLIFAKPNEFNSIARGFFLATCRYIDISKGIQFNGIPSFIFFQDGSYFTLTSETPPEVINMIANDHEENTQIDPNYQFQVVQFKIKCRDIDIYIPFILQGTYLKVTVTDIDYHNFEDDFQAFKFMFLSYFNSFDIIEPQFDDIRWYNDTLTTNPRRIDYNFNIPGLEPLVEVQNQPVHVIVPEQSPEQQKPLEVTEFHFEPGNDGFTEETHYIYPDIEGQVTNNIQNENYQPLPQQEQEQMNQIINDFNQLQQQQNEQQPMEEDQQNADGTWVNLNDIKQVHVDYILPQHYGDNHVNVDGIESVLVFNDKDFAIKKVKAGNVIYLNFEWNNQFENLLVNERIIASARRQTHLGPTANIIISEQDFNHKGNPNVFSTAIINKLIIQYGSTNFKNKLYANIAKQIEIIPTNYQDDYSSLSFFQAPNKEAFEKFIKMFRIFEFLFKQERRIHFAYVFKMKRYKEITILPKSFIGNVLYGKQFYEGKEYPFFMALEIIHNVTDFDQNKRMYVIITNLIRVGNKTTRVPQFTNPGISKNATKGFFDDFEKKSNEGIFETVDTTNIMNIDIKRHNIIPEKTELKVILEIKFAEVYTIGNEKRERVFIRPDYLINGDTNWKLCPYLFMDEYYNLLQYIEINILNYADRIEQLLYLQQIAQQEQQQQQQQQQEVVPQQTEQQEREPIINEANVNDNWNLDGNNNGFNFDQFNSDEYYDGFNHL